MTIYLALGTNIGQREKNLQEALRRLSDIGKVAKVSSFYDTAPVGFVSEHRFLNAVLEMNTQLSVGELLEATQCIEREMGRTKKSQNEVYEDRKIDIDLLCSDEGEWHSEELTLPHPRMMEREFVLAPFVEIAPDFRLPCGDCVEDVYLALSQPRTYAYSFSMNDVAPINRLLQELSPSAEQITAAQLQNLANAPMTRMFVVKDEQEVVQGMISLCWTDMPTGRKAWAEDLVVHSSQRGKGYGKALILRASREAKRVGAKTFNFTSSPNRVSANRMYVALGFEKRDTNVYRQSFEKI